MAATKVGIREFRQKLSTFLESKDPVAITRHGATIGVYLPARPTPSQADSEAFSIGGEKMQALIKAAGISEAELTENLKKPRRKRRTKRTLK